MKMLDLRKMDVMDLVYEEMDLAAWSSVFPLFSPVVMPALLVFDPPLYRILLSIFFLILGSLFFVWLSARIYRVAIMLYGKKPGFRDYLRWILKSD